MSRTRSGASSGSPHPDRGGQPKRWIAGPQGRVGPPPSPAGSTHQRSTWPKGVHPPGGSWDAYLVRLFAQSGTCTGRRTQRPAKIRTSPTRLLIIQRRTESCTSGSLVSRPSGVVDGLSGPSAPELVTPEPEAGGMVGGLSGPSAPGCAPPPLHDLAWGSLSGPADLILPSKMTALASR